MAASRLHRLGRAAAARPGRVIAAWLALVTGMVLLAVAWGGELTDDIRVPGSEAERAREIVGERYPGLDGASATAVFDVSSGTLAEPERAAAIASALRAVAELPDVLAVSDPRETPGAVTDDGRTAYADIRYDASVGEVGHDGVEQLHEALRPARDAGVDAYAGGEVAFATSGAETGTAELVGLLLAVVILLVAFGSVVAAGLPVVVALTSLAVTVGGLTLVAAVTDIATEAPQIAAMIGLGVGIDYALLLITRCREELGTGRTVHEAIGVATDTAGRSVLFAGGTVIIAVCGLFLTGVPLVISLGAVAAAVVALAVLAALTLLPALLALVGHRIQPKAVRAGRRTAVSAETPERSAWGRWAAHVARRPVRYLVLGVALLGALALPATAMELSMPDGGSTAAGTDARRAYDLLAERFGPGANGPLAVLVTMPAGTDPTAVAAQVTQALDEHPGVAAVRPALPAQDGTALLLEAVPTTAPAATATEELVGELRGVLDGVAPAGGEALVTGTTALYVDLTSELAGALPIFMVAVLGLSTLLLLALFRSVPVALTAAARNLLSIAASFGVLVAVFQFGWGLELLGLSEPGPVASFVPIFLFAIVFGLSMDYEVFLMSRVREEYLRTGRSIDGLVRGTATTARVIGSAALIMVVVFFSFALAPEPLLKMLGLGLAVAVALDATVVRLLLVPATVALLGDRNWWLPAPLARVLPRVSVDGPTAPFGEDPPNGETLILYESSRERS